MAVPLTQFEFARAPDAVAALEAVGARHEPALDLLLEHPLAGRVHRCFGVVRNPLRAGGGRFPVRDEVILQAIRTLLGAPENAELAEQLRTHPADYCPISKRAANGLRPALLTRRLHLPWAWSPMNRDFASRLASLHRSTALPFTSYYSESVGITLDSELPHRRGVPSVRPGLLFSLPTSGSALPTVLEPDADDELDPKIGLILEAHAREP